MYVNMYVYARYLNTTQNDRSTLINSQLELNYSKIKSIRYTETSTATPTEPNYSDIVQGT